MVNKENFIKKDDKNLGASIDILNGEEKLIKDGLLEKTKEDLIKMAKNHPKYNDNLSKEQLIDILTDDLNKA